MNEVFWMQFREVGSCKAVGAVQAWGIKIFHLDHRGVPRGVVVQARTEGVAHPNIHDLTKRHFQVL